MEKKEKKASRRAEENEILKQMRDALAENEAAKESEAKESEKAPEAEKKSGGYVPMTDEQIKKVRLILWPILLIAALLVYLATHGYFG